MWYCTVVRFKSNSQIWSDFVKIAVYVWCSVTASLLNASCQFCVVVLFLLGSFLYCFQLWNKRNSQILANCLSVCWAVTSSRRVVTTFERCRLLGRIPQCLISGQPALLTGRCKSGLWDIPGVKPDACNLQGQKQPSVFNCLWRKSTI